MNTHEIYRALAMAAEVINQLDSDLTAQGKGRNLSNVPGFEGANFVEQLRRMATEIHNESPDRKAI